jgi:hypothetical protein
MERDGALPVTYVLGMARSRSLSSANLMAVGYVTASTAVVAYALAVEPLGAASGLLGLVAAVAVAWWIRRQKSVETPSIIVGALAAAALGGGVPAYLIASTPEAAPSAWTAALIISVGCGLRLAWLWGDGLQRLSELIFWVFGYMFLGLAPLVQLRRGVDPVTTAGLAHWLDGQVFWIIGVGLVCAFLGSVYAGRRERTDPATAKPPSLPDARRTVLLAWIGIALSLSYVATLGLGNLFSPRDEFSVLVGGTGGAIFRTTASIPVLVALIALIVLRRSDPGPWTRRTALPIVLGVILVMVLNPISGARYTYGTAYLAVIASLGVIATRTRFRWFTGATLAGLLFLFPLIGLLRRDGGTASGLPLNELALDASLQSGDFDAFGQLSNAVLYVSTEGIAYGRQALGVVLFWVPRDWWPEKPVDTGVLLARYRGYGFTNLSSPLWGELYLNGGWVLLVAGMGALGYWLRRWDDRAIASLRIAGTIGLLSSILPFYLLILLRGSLLQAMSTLTAILLCAAFVVVRRHRSQAQAPDGTVGTATRVVSN